MSPPLIKIEVEHMRQSMVHAFSEHVLKMDGLFQHAIAEACKPEVVQEIVNEAAHRWLKEALDNEVKSYLMFGEGRDFVRAEVEKRLRGEFPKPRATRA
jgi:hypothetical protein